MTLFTGPTRRLGPAVSKEFKGYGSRSRRSRRASPQGEEEACGKRSESRGWCGVWVLEKDSHQSHVRG
jgi:hypothetical protein